MDKKAQLAVVAFELFYREGVHAVGINRVLTEAGVAKKTLYHHFAGKDELVAATLELRSQQFLHWLHARVQAAVPGREALNALFQALDDWFNERDAAMRPFHGCYFINLSAEFGPYDHPLHRRCAAHKTAVQALVRQQVSACVTDAGEVDRLTDALTILQEGAIVRAHVSADKGAALKARSVMHLLLDQVEAKG